MLSWFETLLLEALPTGPVLAGVAAGVAFVLLVLAATRLSVRPRVVAAIVMLVALTGLAWSSGALSESAYAALLAGVVTACVLMPVSRRRGRDAAS